VCLQADDEESDNDNNAEWKSQATALRKRLGLQSNSRPWSDQHSSLIGANPKGRIVEFLNIAAAARTQHIWFANISPSINRKCFGPNLACMLQNSRWYDFDRGIILPPTEHLLLQGLPAYDLVYPESVTPYALYKMAGEGMHAPSVGVILMACFLNPMGTWWISEQGVSSDC
jgi:hypothetical protein